MHQMDISARLHLPVFDKSVVNRDSTFDCVDNDEGCLSFIRIFNCKIRKLLFFQCVFKLKSFVYVLPETAKAINSGCFEDRIF